MPKPGVDLDNISKECCHEMKYRHSRCVFWSERNATWCITDDTDIDYDRIVRLARPFTKCCQNKGADKSFHLTILKEEADVEPDCK